jgi:hypothetical protein
MLQHPLVGGYGYRVVTGSELHRMESQFCTLDAGLLMEPVRGRERKSGVKNEQGVWTW